VTCHGCASGLICCCCRQGIQKDDEEEELADRVFEQAYIPRRLEEVEEYERDHDRLAGQLLLVLLHYLSLLYLLELVMTCIQSCCGGRAWLSAGALRQFCHVALSCCKPPGYC